MNFFLLRHAIAMERDAFDFASDSERPLTAKGKNQLSHVTAAMRMMKLRFDLILSSPLVRARQTAEIVAEDLKLKRRLLFEPELKPGGNPRKLIENLLRKKSTAEDFLLVGHEPELSDLISLLVTGGPGGGFALKKAGLVKLEITRLRPEKCAILAWQLTPALMKRLN